MISMKGLRGLFQIKSETIRTGLKFTKYLYTNLNIQMHYVNFEYIHNIPIINKSYEYARRIQRTCTIQTRRG